MTSKKFTPKAAAPKKRGRPAAKNPTEALEMSPEETPQAVPVTASAADLARKRWEDRRELEKGSGARDGDKLWAPKVEGFVSRWATDEDGRLDALMNKGYFNADTKDFPELTGVISNTDGGSQISFLVTGKDGKPTRQYLMLCAEDIYAQRQSDQEARRQRNEEVIRNAQGDKGLGHERGSGGKSVMYDPTGGNSAFDV